jgi:hypothetical protein
LITHIFLRNREKDIWKKSHKTDFYFLIYFSHFGKKIKI